MNVFEVTLLGIIQGATEFLPVSSSGHVFLLEEFFSLENPLAFALYLHIGTLLAVLVYYRKDLMDLLIGFYLLWRDRKQNHQGREAWLLGLATLATFPTGFLVFGLVSTNMSLSLVGITLIITALLILASEYLARKNPRSRELDTKRALILGLVQGMSVLPGISRSGLTISALLGLGIAREQAARLSFLLSVPTIIGAGSYLALTEGFTIDPMAALVGIVVSFVVGYAAIAWMTKLIKGAWLWFAPYCFILGIIVSLYSVL